MKHLTLLVLLLPATLAAQSLPHFVGQPTNRVHRQFVAKHLAFDTSYRYGDPPTVDYIAYAPYRVDGVPGVLLLHGADSIWMIEWYSRGVDVDSDLSYVIGRNPSGQFSKVVRGLSSEAIKQTRFQSLLHSFSRDLGAPSRSDTAMAVWRGCKSLWLHDGYVRYDETRPLRPAMLQPNVFDSAKALQVRGRISPGFLGMSRAQFESAIRGKYEAMKKSADGRAESFVPYNFHGIPGILTVSFSKTDTVQVLYWSHSNAGSILNAYKDSTSRFDQLARAIENDITPERYNALRASIELPQLARPEGPRIIAYYPIWQSMTYELGSLEYTERRGVAPQDKGMYPTSAEPTYDIVKRR